MKRVILVRPQGPRNVGMSLRICRNFGPCELALVAPERASMLVHPEFEQMSHGAEQARAEIMLFDDLTEALADCHASVAFTARVRGNRIRSDWRELEAGLRPAGDDPKQRLALVFGNEMTGLRVDEVDACQQVAHVRTSSEHTSLNLAVSVGVILSGLFTGTQVHQFEPGGTLLNGDGRQFLIARMKDVFGGQVALTEAAGRDICDSIERVFARVTLENRDARAWHLMLRALGSELEPGQLGLRPNEKGDRKREAMRRHGKLPEGE